jgi:hypothetical protein
MKKTFIIILLLSSFGTALFAQHYEADERQVLGFGLKAGFNYSNVWDANGTDFKSTPKAGLMAGLFVGFPLGRYLGFQPEALISQKGYHATGTILDQPYSLRRTTTYLDFPLLVQLKPIPYLTFVAGPLYSFLIHSNNVYKVGEITIEQQNEFNNDNLRKNILGFTFGADIKISHFILSGRFGWDLQENHRSGQSLTPRYKNRWVQVAVGYKFFNDDAIYKSE